jgi:hypothetical protein
MKRLARTLGAALAFLAASCTTTEHPGVEYVPGASIGPQRFVHDGFGGISLATLETNALPYKVMATALLLAEERRTAVACDASQVGRLLGRYGFLSPTRIANWPAELAQPRLERPLGIVSAEIVGLVPPIRIDAVNLGCAACHAGVMYDREGHATREAWLGLPNTSLDLERYTHDVYAALKELPRDGDELEAAVERFFPGIGWRERFALDHVLAPRIAKRLGQLEAALDAPAPISNGGPGRTNGVGALKLVLGLVHGDRRESETGFTSIPDLAWRGLRSSLLYDGFYAPDGSARFEPREEHEGGSAHEGELGAIVTFFTVPTMGMQPADAERSIPRVVEIMDWLSESYRPPPFPGELDEAKALRGRAHFVERCASCHGMTSPGLRDVRLVSFPNRLIPAAESGTSPARSRAIDAELVRAVSKSAIARHAAPASTGGYVAPILSGLWATAPYLHNGSVPTLWHLLHPAQRPARFQVGGHALDWTKVGIAGAENSAGDYVYPAGYVPWSEPELYDTRRPGLENSGHKREFDGLDEGQKDDLLEYLKVL